MLRLSRRHLLLRLVLLQSYRSIFLSLHNLVPPQSYPSTNLSLYNIL